MPLIDSEKIASVHYMLKRDADGLAKVSPDNVAKVEAMIAENSRYNDSLNTKNPQSSKVCLDCLKQDLDNLPHPKYQTVENAMRAINRENSTRLSAGELSELAKRICALSSSEILEYLEKPTTKLGPNGEKFYLVSYLRKKTATGKRSGRENYSFATKFCHYACMNFFEGKTEADNFPIVDSVVKAAFPKYAANIVKRIVFDDYETFVGEIDSVLDHYGNCISRSNVQKITYNSCHVGLIV